MPSKKRREKVVEMKQIDEAARNLPSYLKGLQGERSQIADAIVAGAPKPSDKFITYADDEDGQMIKPPERGPAGGRSYSKTADKRCQEVRARHLKHWGLRHMTKTIAAQEGLSTKTIERYFARCPK